MKATDSTRRSIRGLESMLQRESANPKCEAWELEVIREDIARAYKRLTKLEAEEQVREQQKAAAAAKRAAKEKK